MLHIFNIYALIAFSIFNPKQNQKTETNLKTYIFTLLKWYHLLICLWLNLGAIPGRSKTLL